MLSDCVIFISNEKINISNKFILMILYIIILPKIEISVSECFQRNWQAVNQFFLMIFSVVHGRHLRGREALSPSPPEFETK